jgi:uncharacterized membrane protein required for colicin V production
MSFPRIRDLLIALVCLGFGSYLGLFFDAPLADPIERALQNPALDPYTAAFTWFLAALFVWHGDIAILWATGIYLLLRAA